MEIRGAGSRRGAARLRRGAQNGLVVAVSLLLCLGVLELAARLLVTTGQERWPVRDIRPDKKIAFLPNSERRYESEELAFTLRTNSHGRRDREWTPEQIGDPDNVLFIGDSLILGYGVDDEWTIPSRLEAESAAAGQVREVFNFGLPGGSPDDYVALLDEAFEIGIRARRVLVGVFVGNDFMPHIGLPREEREARRGSRSRWLPDSKLFAFLKRRVSRSPRTIGWSLTLGRWLGIPVYGTAGSYIFLREQTPEQKATFRRILDYVGVMQERCQADGRTLEVVVIPNKMQVENAEDLSGWIYDVAKPDRMILAYCEERGLRCLDLRPVMTAAHDPAGPPLYFAWDRHLTPEGTRVAAHAIAAFLWGSDAGAQSAAPSREIRDTQPSSRS